MITKYALLNPHDGQYEFFETEEIVKLELAKRALAFYITHAHGISYSKVTLDENGWETWDSFNSIEEINFQEIENNIALKI
jgi:hypothetical protein